MDRLLTRIFRLDRWAQPVTSPEWGAVAVLTEKVKRASNYRLMVRFHHWSWEKACGIEYPTQERPALFA